MNLRSTAWLFAVMLSMLWLFGLMLAFKKNPLDKAYVLPTFQAARDVDVVGLTVQRKPSKEKEAQVFHFVQEGDVWRLKDSESGATVKVESFRINDIVNQVKNARKDEEADVTNDLPRFGLDVPQATITIKAKARAKPAEKEETKEDDKEKGKAKEKQEEAPAKEKEWKFYLGIESPDSKYVYVNSSDEPRRVFAVLKKSLDNLFFTDANALRSKKLFDFSDATAKEVQIKQQGGELELKKGDDNLWRFVKPSLGFADFEGPPAPKDLPPGLKPPEGGVKGLLGAILNIRVDADADFVPPGKDNVSKYHLEEGKEAIRIAVGTPDFKKGVNKETLLVGDQERGYYFARLESDQGVFKLPAKLIDPVVAAIKEPGKLRSLDVGQFDPKQIDAVKLKANKAETKIWHPEGKPWQIDIPGDKAKKANEQAVTKLIESLQGKRQISRYFDLSDAEAKKKEAELGFDAPSLEITLYAEGLQKKEEPKKYEKKDDKKEEKKEEKQDEGAFVLKKDVKPALTLRFGKADKETVNVERESTDGLVSRFVAPKSLLDAAMPAEGPIVFLDPALPPFSPGDVTRLTLERGSRKIELEKGTGTQSDRWLVKEGKEKSDQNLADTLKTSQLFGALGGLNAKKWIKRIGAKDDLKEYGLDAPVLTVTIEAKKAKITPAGAATAIGILAAPVELRLLTAAGAFAVNLQGDKGETITVQFGKESADKDVYAKHSGVDLLFIVPADLVKALRELDLRDKTALLVAEHQIGAGLAGAVAGQPASAVLAASPLYFGQAIDLDPAKVKEVRLSVRSPYELRDFAFQKKDKSWAETTGLKDFNLDAEKVDQLVKEMSKLRVERWVNLAGGTKSDQKLAAKDYLVKLDLVTDAGTITLTVGAALDHFGHFATATTWPDAVFLVPSARVDPLLRGIATFAKERTAAE